MVRQVGVREPIVSTVKGFDSEVRGVEVKEVVLMSWNGVSEVCIVHSEIGAGKAFQAGDAVFVEAVIDSVKSSVQNVAAS